MIITLGPNGARHLDKIYAVPKVEIKDTHSKKKSLAGPIRMQSQNFNPPTFKTP